MLFLYGRKMVSEKPYSQIYYPVTRNESINPFLSNVELEESSYT